MITSPSGAVIRDILHRLRERFPRPVLLWPVTVQGERCAPEVAAAIRGFNALGPGGPVPRPDLLIVARGGGSLEDLWGFNEEIVVRAAAESRIPLISAVGHETDTTLIDFAADRRAPTPTAAAEMAVPVRLDLVAALAGLEHRRRNAVARRLAAAPPAAARPRPRPAAPGGDDRRAGAAARRPRRPPAAGARRLHPPPASRAQPRRAGRFGPHLLAVGLERHRRRLLAAGLGLRPEAMRRGLARLRERLEARDARLARAGARLTRDAAGRLAALGRTLASLDPHNVLERGFAIVRDGGGAVLTRAADTGAATAFELEFADGRVRARPDRPAGRRRSDPGPAQGTLL